MIATDQTVTMDANDLVILSKTLGTRSTVKVTLTNEQLSMLKTAIARMQPVNR